MVWRSLHHKEILLSEPGRNYEMNFTLCVLLVYNDNGSVQTLCITRVSALCTKCLHRPIVIINQQYTKGEIHFIYLHYFHVFGFCFINRYHGNGCVSLEIPTVCTINGRAQKKIVLCDSHHRYKEKIHISQSFIIFNNEFCFQTHLQHNYPEKNVERQYVTSPEMRMTSVISLHSNVTSITS